MTTTTTTTKRIIDATNNPDIIETIDDCLRIRALYKDVCFEAPVLSAAVRAAHVACERVLATILRDEDDPTDDSEDVFDRAVSAAISSVLVTDEAHGCLLNVVAPWRGATKNPNHWTHHLPEGWETSRCEGQTEPDFDFETTHDEEDEANAQTSPA